MSDQSERLRLDEIPDILGWASLARELSSAGKLTVEFLSLPTVPALLNLAGVNEIDGEQDLSWRCCGLYEVKVGRGGPIAELPAEPNRSPGRSVKVSVIGEGLDELTGPGRPLNVFSWEPIAVLESYSEPAGLCVKFGESLLCRRLGRPWSPLKDQVQTLDALKYPSKPIEFIDLYSMRIALPAYVLRSDLLIINTSSARGAMLGNSVGLIANKCLELDLRRYDLTLDVLYPLSYLTLRVRPQEEVSANSLVLRLDSPISISSAEPVTLRLKSGGLAELCPNRQGQTIYLAVGGAPTAFKLLLEATIRTSARAQRPLGSVRAGSAAALVVGHSAGTIKVLIVNPTYYDSQVTFRLAWPVEGVKLLSPLGSVGLAGDASGLVRVPAPRACLCVVYIKVKVPQGMTRPTGPRLSID